MRIAIAGTNTLAYWVAHYLEDEGQHQFILLSRTPKPSLTARGWQVIIVDYGNQGNLIFNLAGIDVVVSTVCGDAQMFLIDAALNAGVERFIPADYGGSLSRRMPGDPLDRGQSAAINRLQQCESRGMAYTVFACGILYERFCPGGMKSANIGQSSGASEEGDYLVNIRSMRSQIPYDASGRPAMISVTAAQDVGHFIVAALDLPQRPREFRIRGDRMNASDLVRVAEMMRGADFERAQHNAATLRDRLTLARSSHNEQEAVRVHLLIATGEGRFDFEDANLNGLVDFTPVRFQDWLRIVWAGRLP
ncbi:hypothetical protein MMC34_006611 [Xylographa carneopallida]|nr:hypothetical protein [Xylographa carneopallida]